MSKLLFTLILLLSICSCISKKKLTYFQSNKFSKNSPTLIENKRPEYKIQPNDILSIRVVSNLDNTTPNIFNLDAVAAGGGINPAANFYVTGYSVDEQGFITIPTIGRLKVTNQTVSQVSTLVQQNVDKYLNNATVVIKLVSFKVSVLGDVRSPGYYYVYNEQVTLPEVLALAGDLTQNGSRKNIKLIRQNPNGLEVVLLDLTDPNIIKSPYYYLLPNDVVYIQPMKAAISRSNLAPLGTFFGAVSAVILVLNYFNPNR
ncbi:polysaccharide biosynthesis/export family protein [Rhodocytophaga aerolata]|uniref:polysaccharide biosynthesis/export family protein n=1 Tax=Rhodocytophaga aerolata TaxID=455078 RepID=UPI00361D61E1